MSNLSEEEQEAIDFFKDNALVRIENEQIVASGNAYKVVILNLIDRLQKELEQEKENNEKQFRIDTAEEVLKWKSKYHLLSRKINGVLEDKIRDRINEIGQKECEDMQTILFKYFIIEMLEELLEE